MSKRSLNSVYFAPVGDADTGGTGRDYEAEALKSGRWVPKAEWSGEPAKWQDAKTFIERGERLLPIVQENLQQTRAELQRAQQEIRELNAASETFRTHVEKAVRREYQQKLEDALKRKIGAIEAGDGATVVEIEGEIKQLEVDVEKEVKEVKKTAPATKADDHPDYPAWLAANPWYGQAGYLQDAGNAAAKKILTKAKLAGKPLPDGKPLFEQVEDAVKSANPDDFPDYVPFAKRNGEQRGNTVHNGEGENRSPPGNRKDHTYANLPAEAKLACDDFIKRGWIKKKDSDGKDLTIDQRRAMYCLEYDWS